MAENEIICPLCWDTQESVWCPKCDKTFSMDGFLRIIFRQNQAAMHAAMLVTHYRHEHITSHDRAWSDPRYRKAIPRYNYSNSKFDANNRAKRQLVRAIGKLVKNNSYPRDCRISARDLVAGFAELKDNDTATVELISQVLAELSEMSVSPELP